MNRVLTSFYETPWAIIPEYLVKIRAVLHRWADGVKLSEAEIRAAVGDAPEAASARRGQAQPRGVGILPVLGILAQRTAGDISTPGTATARVRAQFQAMMNDSSIDAIVLDVDSPGGSVFGIPELAEDIYAARGVKKVVAVANSMAASAAYYIATAADEFVVTPGGMVGSIGVVAAHEDHSKFLEMEGIAVTLISAGKYKVEGNYFNPLDDEARARIQTEVDQYYAMFVNAVARHRGVSQKEVRNGFGEGRMLLAQEAVAENMVDRVETLDQVIERLLTKPRALAPKRSAGTARRQLAIRERESRAPLSR